jgi:hypothetical protein
MIVVISLPNARSGCIAVLVDILGGLIFEVGYDFA